MHRVMHNTCIKHGRNMRTQCIGSTSILLWGKDWSSIRLDRTRSFFTKHFQLFVFRKLLGWKLEKSKTRKYMRHLGPLHRSPWNMTGRENWVQKILNDQREKLCNNLKVPNQTNQFQTQIMIERGNPLLEPTQGSSQVEEKTSRSQEIETRSFHEEAVKHDRTEQPVVSCHINNVPDGSQTRSSHESTSFNVGDETIHDRTGQPVVNRDESGHEKTMLNEVKMDFRIPGLPHSVVKQAESSRVRELVKKIKNHPDRHALQLD